MSRKHLCVWLKAKSVYEIRVWTLKNWESVSRLLLIAFGLIVRQHDMTGALILYRLTSKHFICNSDRLTENAEVLCVQTCTVQKILLEFLFVFISTRNKTTKQQNQNCDVDVSDSEWNAEAALKWAARRAGDSSHGGTEARIVCVSQYCMLCQNQVNNALTASSLHFLSWV